MTDLVESEVLEKTERILQNHAVCDQCLGRQFAWLSTDTTNLERGRSIKTVLVMVADNLFRSESKVRGKDLLGLLASNGMFRQARKLCEKYEIDYEKKHVCHLCCKDDLSVYDRIPSIVDQILEKVEGVQFDTFLVGTIPIAELSEREDELRGSINLLHGETLKSDFNREIGKELEPHLEQKVDFKQPDVVFLYDMNENTVSLQINPLFIFGRYRKLVRGIPQSRWDCSECKGKGCESCNNTGRRYPDSVSEYIGEPAVSMMQGTRYKVHAAGREDIDVLMLGTGRPFVIEISEPKIRHPDLESLRRKINEHGDGKVEVDNLRLSDRTESQTLKSNASSNIKEYFAKVSVEGLVTDELLERAQTELKGITIKQRTPNRVAHRRADLVREKIVHEVKLKLVEDGSIEAEFRVQGGTYVKELISGDEGRTIPSLSSILGLPCLCVELNVTAIVGTQTDHNL